MIINLTQNAATEEQREAGVHEPSAKKELERLLTFESMPDISEIAARAEAIADIALKEGADAAMIDGASFLIHPLHMALEKKGIEPLYAFYDSKQVKKFVGKAVMKSMVKEYIGFIR